MSLDGTVLGSFDPYGGTGSISSLLVVGDEVWLAMNDTTMQRLALDTTNRGEFYYGPPGWGTKLGQSALLPEPGAHLMAGGGLVVIAAVHHARRRIGAVRGPR